MDPIRATAPPTALKTDTLPTATDSHCRPTTNRQPTDGQPTYRSPVFTNRTFRTRGLLMVNPVTWPSSFRWNRIPMKSK